MDFEMCPAAAVEKQRIKELLEGLNTDIVA